MPHLLDTTIQYEYAAQILLIATMAAAKISLSLLIQSLMAEGYSVIVGQGCWWSLSDGQPRLFFAIAFGCSSQIRGHICRCINIVRIYIRFESYV